MLTEMNYPKSFARSVRGPVFVLVMDARGNLLALAPFDTLRRISLPPEQLEPVDGDARVLEASREKIAAGFLSADAAFVRAVESALKRLYDPVFLCEHPLARMNLVMRRFGAEQTAVTCLKRANRVRELLAETIAQLRPAGPAPARSCVPRREWHAYLILHHAYVEGENNYAIMNWLQISEGTFNRTRRRALQTVAHVLMELEQAA